MKSTVERLRHHGIVCTKLTEVPPKALGSRKRITLYIGVDTAGYRCSVMMLAKKSRVVRQEVYGVMALHATLEVYVDALFTKRYIGIDAPLCSKAKAVLEEAGWVLV